MLSKAAGLHLKPALPCQVCKVQQPSQQHQGCVAPGGGIWSAGSRCMLSSSSRGVQLYPEAVGGVEQQLCLAACGVCAAANLMKVQPASGPLHTWQLVWVCSSRCDSRQGHRFTQANRS
jgi:hypothetical protein